MEDHDMGIRDHDETDRAVRTHEAAAQAAPRCGCGRGSGGCGCEPAARGGSRGAGARGRAASRDILVFGPLDPKLACEVTQQLIALDREDSSQPIRVLVNSPGGPSDEGFALVDAIRFVRAPVFTVCVGQAARSAALVMLAPPRERRFVTPHASFALAMPSGGVMGTAADIDVAAREVMRQKDAVLRFLAEASGQPLNKVARDLDRSFRLVAEEAVAYGLVARVLEGAHDLALAGAVMEPALAAVPAPASVAAEPVDTGAVQPAAPGPSTGSTSQPETPPQPETQPQPVLQPQPGADAPAPLAAPCTAPAVPAREACSVEEALPASAPGVPVAQAHRPGEARPRTAFLFGEINPDSAERLIRRLLALDEEAPREGITLLVNSPGGCAASGFAILDVLRLLRAPVTTICTGKACSAGTLVMLAPPRERRFILPHARMMLHQPSMSMRGTALDVEIAARELVRLRERGNAFYARATGQPLERIAVDVLRDYWMDAEASVAYGLVGRVVRHAAELPPAA